MKNWVFSFVACATLGLTSCAGSTSSNLPSSASAFSRARHVAGAAVVIGFFQDPDGGSDQTGLLTFGASGSEPLQTTASSAYPAELLAEPNGGYFVRGLDSKIYEYSAGGSVTRSLGGLAAPTAMAADSSGNLYVIDSGNIVVEFVPGATTPSRIAARGTNLRQIATDAAARLYVAAISTPKIPGSVSVYAGGATRPSEKLVFRKTRFLSIAVDSKRSLLYVGQFSPQNETISVYRAGTSTPLRIIAVRGVDSIVTAANGDVYVLSENANLVGHLDIYSPGAAKLLEHFRAPLYNSPSSCGANPPLAVDPSGDAYVADCQSIFLHPSGGTLEFSPAGKLLRRLGVNGDVPSGIAALNV